MGDGGLGLGGGVKFRGMRNVFVCCACVCVCVGGGGGAVLMSY